MTSRATQELATSKVNFARSVIVDGDLQWAWLVPRRQRIDRGLDGRSTDGCLRLCLGMHHGGQAGRRQRTGSMYAAN